MGAPAGVVFPGGDPSRKIWIVSEVEETHSKVELRLKDILYMVEG